MQRRDFGWFHPFRRPIFAALAAGMLGIAVAARGRLAPRGPAAEQAGAIPAPVPPRRPASGPGLDWAAPAPRAAGSAGAGNTTMTGTAGAGGTGIPPVVFAPSAGAYRRLTAGAFRNSLRDLLQGPVTIGKLEPDSWSIGGFASVSAATVSISADRRRAVSDRDRRRDRRSVCRHHPAGQVAGLHPEERDRHGLLPVLRDQVWPTGLASAAHVRSGHALHDPDRERRRDPGRRQRGHARWYARPAAFAQLPLPDRARGGPGRRRQWVLAIHEQRGRHAAVVLPDELDAGRDAAGSRRPKRAADQGGDPGAG